MGHYSSWGKRLLPPAAFALGMLLAFSSCSDDALGDDTFTIADFGGERAFTGTWDGEYQGEVYTIDVAGGTFDSTGSYAGNNMAVVEDTPQSGRFIIKYTRALKNDNTYTYSTDSGEAPDVGKWYAVYFRVINRSAIALAGGWRAGGPNAFDTEAECRASMTSGGGYFAQTSECKRR